MPAFGVYPIADAQDEGLEVSSTYEGRHVTVTDDEITGHANPDADGFINKGLPLMVGDKIVGIPFLDAAAGADLIPFDTEGIWIVDVYAQNDAGASAVAGGDELYINLTTGVVSKINNTATNRPFGYALGVVAAGTETIAVKVHFDPSLDTQDVMYKTVTSGTYSYGKQWIGLLEGGESTGVAGYFVAQIDGQQTSNIYGLGCWIEPQSSFIDGAFSDLIVPFDLGIYCANGAGQDLSSAWLVGINMCFDVGENPLYTTWIRANNAATTGTINGLWAFANPASCGFVATAAEGSAQVGSIAFASIAGTAFDVTAPVFIRVYDAAI